MSSTASITNKKVSSLVVVLDTTMDKGHSSGDDHHRDKVMEETTTTSPSTNHGDPLQPQGDEDSELLHRFMLPSPLKIQPRSFSDDSERKSYDEDEYPNMLMDTSSDDESVQELLERASANKTCSQTKLLLASSTPSSASSVVISERDEDNHHAKAEEPVVVHNVSQPSSPRRNLWPNIPEEQIRQQQQRGDPSDSDNSKSQVSHTFVGDVLDEAPSDSDDVNDHHRTNAPPRLVSSTPQNIIDTTTVEEDEKIALAERLAHDAQTAVTWLEKHKVDAVHVISASSGGEEDDDEILNNCLDSLQQMELQQDEASVNVAEQNARALQQVLARLQQERQQQLQQLAGSMDDPNNEVIVGSDEDDDDERDVGQYFTVLDALNPPSVADKHAAAAAAATVQQNPPEPEQFKSRKITSKEQATQQEQQQQAMRGEDPTSSVTEGDDLDPEHLTASTVVKLPFENTVRRRRIWMCIGLTAAAALAAIIVGVVIGVMAQNDGHKAAGSSADLKSTSRATPTTSAPTILISPPSISPATSTSPSAYSTGIRINAGASVGYTDTKGRYWQPDNSFTKGTAHRFSTSSSHPTVANTQDAGLFLTQRSGTVFQYSLPLYSYAVYRVDLHFAELYDGAFAVGQRVMEVDMERVPVLRNYDIFQKAGAFNATTETFFIPVSDGALNILFIGTTSNATVAALEITLTNLDYAQFVLTSAPSPAP